MTKNKTEWIRVPYSKRMGDGRITLHAYCNYCDREKLFKLTEEETATYFEYLVKGREMGPIQCVFPRVPAWIRSGAIDRYADGFCICPTCSKEAMGY